MFDEPGAGATTLLPYCVYTVPEIAMVGQTERELTESSVRYEVGVGRFDDLAKGQMAGDDVGFLKIIFDPEVLEVLGAHIIGTNAGELIHIAQMVMTPWRHAELPA